MRAAFASPLRKRDGWTVVPIDHSEAVNFCRLWHYAKSAPNTGTYVHGLAFGDFEHLGATVWLPPTKPAAVSVAGDGWRGVLCLSRLVIAPEAPKNAASFLLAGSRRRVDRRRWPVLLTYADTAMGHTGAIYLADNWTYLGETAGGDTWVGPDGEQRGRKRGGRNLTVAEMRAAGFERRPSAPKRKFVHRVAGNTAA